MSLHLIDDGLSSANSESGGRNTGMPPIAYIELLGTIHADSLLLPCVHEYGSVVLQSGGCRIRFCVAGPDAQRRRLIWAVKMLQTYCRPLNAIFLVLHRVHFDFVFYA